MGEDFGTIRKAALLAGESDRMIRYRIGTEEIAAVKLYGARDWVVDLQSVRSYVRAKSAPAAGDGRAIP